MPSLIVQHNIYNGPLINVFLNDEPLVENLAYTERSGVLKVNSGKQNILVTSFCDSTEIIEKEIDIQKYNYVMISGTNNPENIDIFQYIENGSCPEPGTAQLRVINGTEASVDVTYNNSAFDELEYGESTGYTDIPLGKGILRSGNIVYTGFAVSGGLYTAVITGSGFVVTRDNPDQCYDIVEDFDVQAYMGKWYQIASIPQFFSLGCIRSVAYYTLLDEGIKVLNICYDDKWNVLRTINGLAIPGLPCRPAGLKVSFPGMKSNMVNYLVHEVEYDSYAIVGSPDRSNLYFLSRTRSISEESYLEMKASAESLGYDVTKIKIDNDAVY